LSPLTGVTGVPVLPNALVTFECESHARFDGGDHEIFVGRVVALRDSLVKRGRPLVFFDGRYRQLAGVGDAHTPPSEAVYLHGW
jgi:flavin reductase (DIM6/NTAB) family NADH-FMN oxidoreductase RutF